ncbi:uncharacterized protein At4g02000-like [Brassica rapa]|nr:uncharacterized protein At4g02000-like [Brassica rapa]
MADNLRRAIQDLNLGIDDDPVPLSAAVCNEARRVNQFSLIGRPSMQTKQNVRALLTSLPKMWGLPGLISGRIVDRRKFQFVFPTEEMLLSVINRGPWAFNERMLIISRWVPGMDDADLNYIPLWVQIRGIPLEYLTEQVIHNIGDRMGEVMTVDFNPSVNAAVEFVRIRLNWNVGNPLKFQRNFQFSPGVNTLLKFRYERLRGFCDQCGMITHDSGECPPAAVVDQMDANNEEEDPPNDQAGGEENEEDAAVAPDGPAHDIPMDQVNDGETGPGSHVALLQQFSSTAPMVITSQGYEQNTGEVRMKRRNDFVAALLEEGSSSRQRGSGTEMCLRQENESDEESDHIILAMEARRSSEFGFSQYGSFLQEDFDHEMDHIHAAMQHADDQGVSKEISSLGKRPRMESEMVDKFPVGRMKMSHEFNALRKLQEDYGQDQAHDNNPQIDRGAVGPVPPDEP